MALFSFLTHSDNRAGWEQPFFCPSLSRPRGTILLPCQHLLIRLNPAIAGRRRSG